MLTYSTTSTLSIFSFSVWMKQFENVGVQILTHMTRFRLYFKFSELDFELVSIWIWSTLTLIPTKHWISKFVDVIFRYCSSVFIIIHKNNTKYQYNKCKKKHIFNPTKDFTHPNIIQWMPLPFLWLPKKAVKNRIES